jgi:hypothetical protein
VKEHSPRKPRIAAEVPDRDAGNFEITADAHVAE